MADRVATIEEFAEKASRPRQHLDFRCVFLHPHVHLKKTRARSTDSIDRACIRADAQRARDPLEGTRIAWTKTRLNSLGSIRGEIHR